MADPLRPSGPQIPGSLMGEIQSEVAVEATPLLSFVLRNSRIIVTCIVLLVLVIAGVGGWQWHQTRVEREAHLELGRILVSTQGPERIAALETFLPAAPSAMKSGVQLEIATTALGLEQYGKAADAYAAVAAAARVDIIVPPPFMKVNRNTGGRSAVSFVANWFITNTAAASAIPQI